MPGSASRQNLTHARRIIRSLAALAIGTAVGSTVFTFTYAKGGSYLTDRPEACANCHVMQEQYSGWLASSHRSVAGCNTCHTPPGSIAKYLNKMQNGWRHSVAFTSGAFVEPIQIGADNLEIANAACLNCHAPLFARQPGTQQHDNQQQCTHCHQGVGHGAQQRTTPL